MRKRARKNAVQRSIAPWILLVYHQARINRSKTEQDASSSRRVRIRRGERTYAYVTKTKRKLDDEIRSGFSVLQDCFDERLTIKPLQIFDFFTDTGENDGEGEFGGEGEDETAFCRAVELG